jgi:glycosyltransferase involved in cell wall biosynthesis
MLKSDTPLKFCIITHVVHRKFESKNFAYAPYVREMNLWLNKGDKLIIVAPKQPGIPTEIDIAYNHENINFIAIPEINITTKIEILKTTFLLPIIIFQIFRGMILSNHIHLRCPGNIGLIGCFLQIFFPFKYKTAKYAGNWDWNTVQPWSYRLQQKILRNTFITRNMQTLVYGDWNETKNIKSFFTASYSENEIIETPPRIFEKDKPLKFIFVGALSEGKRPLLCLEVIKKLKDSNIPCVIHFYGEGKIRHQLEDYILRNKLLNIAFLHGNADSIEVKKAYQESHFLLFISKSEGWPKVVAESMFWGCFPLTSSVSCVPEMIGNGIRGELIEPNPELVIDKIKYYLNNPLVYQEKCNKAMTWSREFTLEKFEEEVKKILI